MQSNQTIDKLKDYDFLRTILANLPAVAFVIAPDGTILFAEGKGFALAGLQTEDLPGANVSMFFSLYPELEEKLQRVLEGETVTSTVTAPSQRSFEFTYSPMRDDRGLICGVIGVAQDVTERIERERALREKESWFRAIFESARDSIFIKDKSFRYVQVSLAMEQLFGLPARELVGKTDEDLFGPEAGAHLREVDARVLVGEVVEEENTKPVNGEPRSFHVIKAPMRDAAGTITGLCGIARDITERRRAEERMLKSESLHRALIETTDTGYVVIDDQGVLLDANPEYVRLTGRLGLEEIRGKSIVDWTADHDKEKNAKAVEECSQKGFIRNLEIDYVDSKGNIIPVEINATVIERCGTPIILSMCRDITERKRAEEALRESQEVLQAVLNSIPVRVFWKDRDLKYLGCNMPFARDAGFEKPDDIIGKDDRAMGWREQAELYRADDRGVIESGNAKLHIEEPQTTPSGEQIQLLTSKVPLRDVGGAIVGVLGAYQDITERKRAEAELAQVNRALRMLSDSNQALIRMTDEAALLNEVCRIAVETGGYRLAWVGFAEQDEAKTVRPAAHAGFESGYIESANITWADNERGRGPGGIVIRTGRPVIVRNISGDPTFAPWREEAVRHGYQSMIALPLTSEGRTFGALGIYTSEACAFDAKEVEILEELAGNLAFGITALRARIKRDQAEEALHENEAMYHSVVTAMAEGVTFQAANGAITAVNPAAEMILGLAAAELIGQTSEDRARNAKIIQEDGSAFPGEFHPSMVTLRTGEPQSNVVMGIHKPDETLIWISVNSQPLISPGEPKPYAVVTTFRDITERMRAETQKEAALEELRESETRLSMALEVSNAGIWEWNLESNEVSLNARFNAMLGYTPGELPTTIQEWLTYHHPEDVPLWMSKAQAYLRSDSPIYESEHRIRTKAGNWNWVFTRGRLVNLTTAGSPKQFIGIAMNVTERKQAERELRESEEKFSRAFQSGAALMAITEAGTDIFVDVNDAFLTILGFSRNEIIGKTIQESGALVEVARFEAAKQETADSQHLPDQEMMIRTKSGDLRYGIFSADRINVGGKSCILTVMTDITKRRVAEQALRDSENTYRAIFENTGNATLILEEDTTISLVNSEFEKLAGYAKAETEGKMRWTELVVEEDIDRMLIQHRLRQTNPSAALKSYEFRMRIKNGMVKDILLSIDLIPGTTKSIASFTDITKRKRAEEEREQLQRQLQQSQKLEAIGTMAGGIAHDFNNILTGILGFTELVCSEVPEDSEIYSNLAEVVKAGRRARDLVKQILSFSRRAETEKSLISLVTIVKDALKLIRSVTPSQIAIKQNLTASPARAILADPTQMHQVVLNLCINAADAMPDGGVLEISVEEVRVETESRPEQTQLPSGCYLKLTVRDSGDGMPPEVRERIFEPYFTTKQVGKGTGMGLAVVHGVVQEHGGSIAVSSAPGKGTAFEVYLPIVEAALDSEIESAPVIAFGSESILFVDDETMITNLQRSQLGKWGYRVTATENSATALGIFRASPRDFDLVITDQSMPGLSGVKLAQAIHEISPSTPIILCTGFDEGISRENAGMIGIHAILTKPVTGAEFSRTIRMVLDGASTLSQA